MRCIAKIAEIVYPKLVNRPVVPLTPRRRTQSISVPYDFPSPVPGSEDTDDSKENESDRETVEEQPSQKKISEDNIHEENANSTDNLEHQSGDTSSHCEQTQTSESCCKPADSTHSEREKHSCVVTKMLFEILQNLLADILAILDKVT